MSDIKITVYVFLSLLFCWHTYAGGGLSKATQEAEAYKDNDDEEIEDAGEAEGESSETAEYASEKIEFSELPEEIIWIIFQYADDAACRLISTEFKKVIDENIRLRIDVSKLYEEGETWEKGLAWEKIWNLLGCDDITRTFKPDKKSMASLKSISKSVDDIEFEIDCRFCSYELRLAKKIANFCGKKKKHAFSYSGPLRYISADLKKKKLDFVELELSDLDSLALTKFLKIPLQDTIISIDLELYAGALDEKYDELISLFSAPNLKSICLFECDTKYQYKVINFCTELLQKTNITKIVLCSIKLGDEGALALAKILPDTKIVTLCLCCTFFSCEGAKALAKALPNTQIRILSLSQNSIGNDGVLALAKILPDTKIVDLNLYQTNFSCEGAKALAKALPNTQIRILSLIGNYIGVDDVLALAKILSNTKIVILNLSNTGFYDNGTAVKVLAKALLDTQIRRLSLFYNNIGFDGVLKLLIASLATEINYIGFKGKHIGHIEQSRLKNVLKLGSREYDKAKEECERKYGPVIEKPRKVKFD